MGSILIGTAKLPKAGPAPFKPTSTVHDSELHPGGEKSGSVSMPTERKTSMPLPPIKKPLNFNLPPEFANNPNISVGPAAGPTQQKSGWGGQAMGGVGPGPSFGDLQMQAAGMMSPAGITDSSPASVVMASRSIDAAAPASRISQEILPGGNSNGPIELQSAPLGTDLEDPGSLSISKPFDPSGGAMGDMNAVAQSGGGQLGGQAPQPQGTDWKQVGSDVQGAIGDLQQAFGGGGGQEPPRQMGPTNQIPQVPVDVMPNLPQMAPTGMGPGIAQSAQASRPGQEQQPDRMARIKSLLQTMMAR